MLWMSNSHFGALWDSPIHCELTLFRGKLLGTFANGDNQTLTGLTLCKANLLTTADCTINHFECHLALQSVVYKNMFSG
eukprot:5501332-Pleurochrysis_carterae.AAC.1